MRDSNDHATMEIPWGTDPRKLVRRYAPSTSVEAAMSVDSGKLEALVYETIKKAGMSGCISEDVLNAHPGLPYSSVTARYRALLDKGFIEIIGTRPCSSGRNQRIMRAV